MTLARMNLSVALVVSLLSVVGCNDHEKATPASAATGASTAIAAPSGETTLAVAKPDANDKPTLANVVTKTESDSNGGAKASGTKSSRSTSGSLEVKRLVVARGIEDREPTNPGTAFWKGDFDRLYAFVELKNPQQEDSHVVVKFIPPSGKGSRGNVTLAVGAAKRWRTWASSHSVEEKGTWTAVVTAEDGHELARQTFDIL